MSIASAGELPRHDDLENPPDFVTLRDDYWQLWDAHHSKPSAGEWKPYKDNCIELPDDDIITCWGTAARDRLLDAHNAALRAKDEQIAILVKDVAWLQQQLAAASKDTERQQKEMKHMNDQWERLHKALGTKPENDWDEGPFLAISVLKHEAARTASAKKEG